MIVFLTGKPGSGKSYYAISMIRKLLLNPDNVVFSNIEGFRFERWLLMNKMERHRVAEAGLYSMSAHGQYIDISDHLISSGSNFFHNDLMCEFLKPFINKKCFFFIDECQRFFPEKFSSVDVIYFFDYHRHYGLDIFLITQSMLKICKPIRELTEYEVNAVPKSVGFGKRFIYKKKIGNTVLNRELLTFDERVAYLYSSFKVESSENSSRRLFIVIAFCFSLAFVFLLIAKNIVLSMFS